MKTEELMNNATTTPPNHHIDALPSLPVDIRRKAELRRIEEALPAKFNSSDIDAARLAAELRKRIRGEVRFDNGSRALYATDGSNYRQVPIGVVIPKDTGDILATVAASRRYGAPVLARGGGTSLAGQCCNVAIVIDLSKYMHHILEIDPVRKQARVATGPDSR